MEMSHFQSKLSELEKATCNADTKYNEDKNTFMRLQKELDCLNVIINHYVTLFKKCIKIMVLHFYLTGKNEKYELFR